MHVIAVDDDDVRRTFISAIPKTPGDDPVEAGNGERARDLPADLDAPIAVCDLDAPITVCDLDMPAIAAGLETVTVVLPDRGRPAPPGSVETAPACAAVDAMAETGRGLPLIGRFADGVSYRSAGGTNRPALDVARGERS